MIRFSAGLVVVALGVLIGGGVTSKLSLVYVSIAISALALIAWAIGVFLKRDELRKELFGNGPELAPADAGASAGTPAPGQSAPVPLAPAALVASPVPPLAQNRSTHGEAAFIQGAFNTAANAAAFSPAAQVPPATPVSPAAPARPAWAPVGGWAAMTAAPPETSSGTSQGTLPGTSQGTLRAWDGSKAPQASTPSTLQAPPPAATGSAGSAGSGVKPVGVGSGGTLPSWFDRPAQFEPPVPTPAPPSTASASSTETSGAPDTSGDVDALAADEDDDWPTRYSWLDDDETDEPTATAETDEPTEVAEVTESVESKEVDEADEPEPAASALDEPTLLAPLDEPTSLTPLDEPTSLTPSKSLEADSDAELPKAELVEAAAFEAEEDVPDPPSPANLARDETAAAELSAAEPSTNESPANEPTADESPSADESSADESPAGEPPAEARNSTKLVSVVPGVPRYHDPDCILIRFMPEDDIQKKSIPEAKAGKCTPCAACQPED